MPFVAVSTFKLYSTFKVILCRYFFVFNSAYKYLFDFIYLLQNEMVRRAKEIIWTLVFHRRKISRSKRTNERKIVVVFYFKTLFLEKMHSSSFLKQFNSSKNANLQVACPVRWLKRERNEFFFSFVFEEKKINDIIKSPIDMFLRTCLTTNFEESFTWVKSFFKWAKNV